MTYKQHLAAMEPNAAGGGDRKLVLKEADL